MENEEICLEPKFILINGKDVRQVIELGKDPKGRTEFVDCGDVYTPKNYQTFDNKKDAMYSKLIIDLQSGTPLSNYKRSKYYKYYCSRLGQEYPEYMI